MRLLVSGQLWLLQIPVLVLLCASYSAAASPGTWLGRIFVHGGRLSCAASLSLVPGLLCLALAGFVAGRRPLAILSSSIWALALLAVYVDTRLYGIFRYHFNGLVWNVLTTSGADEAVHISTREIATVLLAFAALLFLECAAFLLLWRWAGRRVSRSLPTPAVARPGLAWKLLLVPNMCLVAGVYAWADLARDPHVMAYARVYPLYPRLTVKRFAQRFLGVELKDRPRVEMPASGILLHYPQTELTLGGQASPNILVIVVDSLRADMLEPQVMPNTSALAEHGRVFRDHLSTGNATRFGLFGLFYGLHGSYWKPVYDEHRSPVLLDALLARGYAMRFLTSASWDFPEFRSTLWVKAEEAAEDRLPSSREGARDDGVAERFEQWLTDTAGDERPFFAFLLLDAPHGRYCFPEEHGVFRPYAEDVEYLEASSGLSVDELRLLFNRYKNSVHYADSVVGRVLDALELQGEMDETLIVVTGDHGEEFGENGFLGHTSNFTRAQVHVPLVLTGPRIPPGSEERATSHADLPATLLELLGADPASRPQWTLGGNLLEPVARRTRVVSGWSTLGVYVGEEILEVPFTAYRRADVAVYDPWWQRRFDDDGALEREGPTLVSLALECRRFLR